MRLAAPKLETAECRKCAGQGMTKGLLDEPLPCSNCGGIGRCPTSGTMWLYKGASGHVGARIASLTQHGGNWRLTIWDKRGPVCHSEAPSPTEIMRDLRGHYRHGQAAARLLDYWSGKPDWKTGLGALQHIRRLSKIGRPKPETSH